MCRFPISPSTDDQLGLTSDWSDFWQLLIIPRLNDQSFLNPSKASWNCAREASGYRSVPACLARNAERLEKRSVLKTQELDQIKIARLHHNIANARKNFHFKTADQLCAQSQTIFAEDLNTVAGQTHLKLTKLNGQKSWFVHWTQNKIFR